MDQIHLYGLIKITIEVGYDVKTHDSNSNQVTTTQAKHTKSFINT